jgi:tRNA1(Val) A37 N6-methylase TrmN6
MVNRLDDHGKPWSFFFFDAILLRKGNAIMRKTDFLPGTSLRLIQRDDMFRFNGDTAALAAFVNVRKHDRILDIGTNNGVLLLACLLKGGKEGVGIDLFDEAVELARENAELNGIDNAFFIQCTLEECIEKAFDLIVCNPPYFKNSTDEVERNPFLSAARYEKSLPMEMVAKHAYRLLKEKGRLCLVHRADRITELNRILSEERLTIKRIRFIHHDLDKNAVGVLIEAMKNGADACVVEAPYIQNRGDRT